MITYIVITVLFIMLVLVSMHMYLINKSRENARKMNTYIQAIVKNVPLIIYFKDLKGNIILANQEFAKATGCPCKELEHKNITEIYTANCIVGINDEDEYILRTGESFYSEKIMTFINDKSSYYRIVKSPVFEHKGKISGFIIVLNNIDKEKEIETNKENFIATLTHDLKTPTCAQINTLKMLLNGAFGDLNNDQKEIIELAKRSCKYVFDLIATVLDTYRYENGKIQLNPETFDITYMISTLAKSLECMTCERNQTIIFKDKQKICEVCADRLQIKRVILNLLSNAITYGHKNSTIEISVVPVEDGIEFSVKNQSEQIPEKELANMFKRFKETKLSYFNKASTGLGLYLSKKIIDMHKGEIFAKSFPGGECIFGFKLPNSFAPNVSTEKVNSLKS